MTFAGSVDSFSRSVIAVSPEAIEPDDVSVFSSGLSSGNFSVFFAVLDSDLLLDAVVVLVFFFFLAALVSALIFSVKVSYPVTAFSIFGASTTAALSIAFTSRPLNPEFSTDTPLMMKLARDFLAKP